MATPTDTRPPDARSSETRLSRRLRALPPDSRGLRWAWIVLGSLFAIALLAFTTFQVISQLAHDEETTTQVFEATGVQTIDVRVDAGAIRVVGTDEGSITVTAHVSNGLRSTTHREQVQGDALVLRGECPGIFSNFCSVDYTIEAPHDVRVIARGDNSSIAVSEITGGADLAADNGGIEVRDVDGPLVLSSDNGSITAEAARSTDVRASSDNGSIRLVLLRPPDRVLASSDNGGITIVVPDTDDTYATDLHTDNGGTTDEIRTDPASARTITARSDNGSITVRYPN